MTISFYYRYRRRLAGIFIAGLLLISGVFFLFKIDVIARFQAKGRSFLVGEPVVLKFTALHNKEVSVRAPNIQDQVDGMEVIEQKALKFNIFFVDIICKKVVLAAYKPGEYKISGVNYYVSNDGGRTWEPRMLPELVIDVKSVLPKDFGERTAKIRISGSIDSGRNSPFSGGSQDSGGIREISVPIRYKILEKETIRYPIKKSEVLIRFVIFFFSGVLAVGLLILFLKVKRILSKRKLSPKEIAIGTLNRIQKELSEGKISMKEYCAFLQNTLITFLKKDMGLNDKEMVFTEIKSEIVDLDTIGYQQKKYFLDLISLCEEIKYAPEEPEILPEELDAAPIIDFITDLSKCEEKKG